jgi:hypothetical protein
MKTKYNIMIDSLEKGIELKASYVRIDEVGSIISNGNTNLIYKNGVYRVVLREVNVDNNNYLETSWDRNEELNFKTIEELESFLKSEISLKIEDFSKAKNYLYFKNK